MKNQRTAILTGAYGAIGKAIAEGMAAKGYQLVMIGRNEEALKQARDEVSKATANSQIHYNAIDLSQKEQVRQLAGDWEGPLHVLINNAAATPRSRTETPQGIETQFATNVLGYFWMMQYFAPHMEGQEDARIVNVASYWAGDLDLDDPEFRARPYDNDTAYRQSKQADRILTVAFAGRLKDKGIAVLSAHPGDVRSKLSTSLGYGGWESPGQGASTPLYCATDPAMKGVTGQYVANKRIETCQFSRDNRAVEKLYGICSRY